MELEEKIIIKTALDDRRLNPTDFRNLPDEEITKLIENLHALQRDPNKLTELLPDTIPSRYELVGVILKIRNAVEKTVEWIFDHLIKASLPNNHDAVLRCLISMANALRINRNNSPTETQPDQHDQHERGLSTASLLMTTDMPFGLDVLEEITNTNSELKQLIDAVRFSEEVHKNDSTEILSDNPLCWENWGILIISDERIQETEKTNLKNLLIQELTIWEKQKKALQNKLRKACELKPHEKVKVEIDSHWERFHAKGITVEGLLAKIDTLYRQWTNKTFMILETIQEITIQVSDRFEKRTDQPSKIKFIIDGSASIQEITSFLQGEF